MEGRFLRRLKAILSDCVRLSSTDHFDDSTRLYCVTRLEAVERSLERGGLVEQDAAGGILADVRDMLAEFRKGCDNNPANSGLSRYSAPKEQAGRGPPTFVITQHQLEFFQHCEFTVPEMAAMLGVSASTVRRRMNSFGMTIRSGYTRISDTDLDQAVRDVVRGNQRIGPNAVKARLLALNIKVQRQRVRDSLTRVEPAGAAIRSVQSICRRRYTVAGPNSLWHIDGNHKLIRWRIVIHGGVDGYSRMIVFLSASPRNTQEVVSSLFLEASAVYGLPSRVRVDHGGENNELCSIMEVLRGPDRGSAIRGTSVHNQRVERSWVDMWNGVTNVYHDMFHFMESTGMLVVDNSNHMWALHFVFLPRINRDLARYRQQWNHHGLRTEHHKSPMQLFVSRSLELCNSSLTAMQELFGEEVAPRSGDVLAGELDASQLVVVPGLSCPLTDDQLETLSTLVDPLDDSKGELGIELYIEVTCFLEQTVS